MGARCALIFVDEVRRISMPSFRRDSGFCALQGFSREESSHHCIVNAEFRVLPVLGMGGFFLKSFKRITNSKTSDEVRAVGMGVDRTHLQL